MELEIGNCIYSAQDIREEKPYNILNIGTTKDYMINTRTKEKFEIFKIIGERDGVYMLFTYSDNRVMRMNKLTKQIAKEAINKN